MRHRAYGGANKQTNNKYMHTLAHAHKHTPDALTTDDSTVRHGIMSTDTPKALTTNNDNRNEFSMNEFIMWLPARRDRARASAH